MDNSEALNINNNSTLFWKTIGLTGLIFGSGAFFFKTLLTYIRLNVGLSPYVAVDIILAVIVLAWFIKACGGLFVSWYYSKKAETPVTMGRAAMMGFITGVAITIVTIILAAIWHWIDPSLVQQKFQSDVTIINSLDIPNDQKQLFIKSLKDNMKGFHNPGKLLLSGIFTIAVPNLITAMIGAKIMDRKKDK